MIALIKKAEHNNSLHVFLLPTFIGDEIEMILNSFWWGAKGDNRKVLVDELG
jgi:hypothetical protein